MESANRVIKAKILLVLDPQPEGGYTVTSPLLPELITEGDTMSEALANVEDAFCAVVEIYQDRGRPLPPSLYESVSKQNFRPLSQNGYQPPVSQSSPTSPPSNPPNQGSSGKK